MKFSKLESLERKKAALAAQLSQVDQDLGVLNDESAAAKAKLAKVNAALCGTVLYRLMKKRHEADPALAEKEIRELDKLLVNSRERKAFGLPPLRAGSPEDGAQST